LIAPLETDGAMH